MMIVTLYTSRKVLELLGIDDFGLYNTIGGVVLIFTFVNAALSSSTARFLAYELGKSDYSAYTKTFIHRFAFFVIGRNYRAVLCQYLSKFAFR